MKYVIKCFDVLYIYCGGMTVIDCFFIALFIVILFHAVAAIMSWMWSWI